MSGLGCRQSVASLAVWKDGAADAVSLAFQAQQEHLLQGVGAEPTPGTMQAALVRLGCFPILTRSSGFAFGCQQATLLPRH